MKTIEQIKSVKRDNSKFLADASDVFSYIDSDFKNWNTDKESNTPWLNNLEVKELTENATFSQIFTDPEKMCLSQESIINFCREHKDLLSDYYTFFLFKANYTFFVAHVYFYVGRGLCVFVYRFDDVLVWDPRDRHRVFFPLLALDSSESDTLNPSGFETLQKAIDEVKKAGYVIYKQI